MAGVRGSKADKMQAEASKATDRSRKGRNKVPKVPRQDKKKGSETRRMPKGNRSG
ncbi:hypothetical protein [Archangium lipolyticum]|jgi:hypothetical protein|uniref:hypothetical protein n=1 Tax=Archangium lipolyticum TaxID=2970465 RepID=UPI00214A7E8F|nr:hypothetical protein [Archangium lipolyticum]